LGIIIIDENTLQFLSMLYRFFKIILIYHLFLVMDDIILGKNRVYILRLKISKKKSCIIFNNPRLS